MSKYQNGFSAIEAILISAIVVVLGGVGFVAYKQLTAPKMSAGTTAHVADKAAPSATADETASWKTYSSDQIGFTFKYPPTWVLGDSSMCLYGVKLGESAAVAGTTSSCDVNDPPQLMAYAAGDKGYGCTLAEDTFATLSREDVTMMGAPGSHTVYTVKANSWGEAVGNVHDMYCVVKDGFIYTFDNSRAKGSDISDVLRTIALETATTK